jgi:4-hydroxybenzoate polyprenyltransferase
VQGSVSPSYAQSNLALALFKSLRPKQWVKNGFVLFPLMFWLERGLTIPINDEIVGKLLNVGALFVAFCLAASAGYQVNDLVDVEKDRLHPTKCRRPIASGLISVGQGAALACLLAVSGICLGMVVSPNAFASVLAYLALTNFYNLRGKNVVYLDVVIVGILYGIRVAGGFDAAALYPAGWELWVVLASLLATFVELGKRHAEFRNVGPATKTRSVLAKYSDEAFNTLYIALSGLIVVTYIPASKQIGGLFAFTVVLVAYGLWSFRKSIVDLTEDVHPLEVFLHSRPLLVTVASFLALLGLTVAMR